MNWKIGFLISFSHIILANAFFLLAPPKLSNIIIAPMCDGRKVKKNHQQNDYIFIYFAWKKLELEAVIRKAERWAAEQRRGLATPTCQTISGPN